MTSTRARHDAGVTVLACTAYAAAVAVGRSTRIEGTETALIWPAAAVCVIWFLLLPSRRMTVVTGVALVVTTIVMNRSEERRVGKECLL